MKPENGNSHWRRLETLQACAFLADRASRRWLVPFLTDERSVSEVAVLLGQTPTAVYKRVRRMLELGLLHETRSEPRAGKAIRYYRAVADTFFIPFRIYPPEQIGLANRQHYQEIFVRALERTYHDEYFVELDWGAQSELLPSGDLHLKIVQGNGETWDYLGAKSPAIASGWNVMWLDFTDAKALQREMIAVLGKYLGKKGSRAYMTGVFICEAQEELGATRPSPNPD